MSLLRAPPSRVTPSQAAAFETQPLVSDFGPGEKASSSSAASSGGAGAVRIVGGVLASLAIIGIAVIAVIALVRTFGSVTVTDLRVCGTLDLSCVDSVVPQPWFVPQPGPVIFKRVGHGYAHHKSGGKQQQHAKTPSFDYEAPPFGPSSIILGNAASSINVRFPARMLGHEAQTYYIFSNTSFLHTVSMTSAFDAAGAEDACPSGAATFDRAHLYNTFVFDGASGSYVVFRVVDCSSVMVLATHGVNVCTEDLTECVDPTIDDFTVANAKVTVSLTAGNVTASTIAAGSAALTNLTVSGHATLGTATITSATVTTGTITTLTSTAATIATATINALTAATATIVNLTTTTLSAVTATITTLTATTLSAVSATIATLSATTIHSSTVITNAMQQNAYTHNVYGNLLSTHGVQHLNATPAFGAYEETLAGAPVGPTTIALGETREFGGIAFTSTQANAQSQWTVKTLNGVATEQASVDATGLRVMQVGNPNAWGGEGDCGADSVFPRNSDDSIMTISTTSYGQLRLHLRYSTELNYDFVTVNKNGNVLFSDSGAGPSPTDGYKTATLEFFMSSTDTVTLTFDKDNICWGGYDNVYFYAEFREVSSASLFTMPADLTAYAGKTFHVCSINTFRHDIVLQGAADYWDPATRHWKVLRLNAQGACATFTVSDNVELAVISRDPAQSLFCVDADRHHCIDPVRPDETNAFHGLFRAIAKRVDIAYIRLDMTTVPATLYHCRGPSEAPEECVIQPYVLDAIATNVLKYQGLLEVLHLQGDAKTIVHYVNYDRVSTVMGNMIFNVARKVDRAALPEFSSRETGIRTGEPDIDNPVQVLRRGMDLFLNLQSSLSRKWAKQGYIGYYPAVALMDEIITTGVTETSSVAKVRISTAAAQETNLTEFYTEFPVHAFPPGYVTVAGFSGACNVLNGVHLLHAFTNTVTDFDSAYQDYGPNPLQRTNHHIVLVYLNSTGLPVTHLNVLNMSACPGSTPTLSMTAGPVKANSSPITTHGAFNFWWSKAIRNGLHVGLPFYGVPRATDIAYNPLIPYATWNDMSNVVDDTGVILLRTRRNFNGHYMPVNPSLRVDRTSAEDFNGPFGIVTGKDSRAARLSNSAGVRRGTHFYFVAMENYLTNVAYPAYQTVGNTRFGDDNIFASQVYPGPGRDEFHTEMFPMGTVPPATFSYVGESIATLSGNDIVPFDSVQYGPNGGIFDLYSTAPLAYSNRFRQEMFFAGLVNLNYTGGTRIGYIRINSQSYVDHFRLALSADLCPSDAYNASSPRFQREALTKMLSTMTHYLVDTLEVEHVILDNRANRGGCGECTAAFRELFGGGDGQLIFKSELYDYRAAVDTAEPVDVSKFSYLVDAVGIANAATSVYPDLTEQNYPSSTFSGGSVIVLTDDRASSGGDIFPNYFLGAAMDLDLGNGTTASMVGSVDGRLDGYSGPAVASGISYDHARVRLNGDPKSALRFSFDLAFVNRRADDVPMCNRHPSLAMSDTPTLTGLSGSNALPMDWETLTYPDRGYTTNSRARLAGDTRPQTPFYRELTNPLQTFAGSNVVRVHVGSTHGYSVGNVIALNDAHRPVPATAGFSSFRLTGQHTVSSIFNASSFDIVISLGTATSNNTAVGGNIRVSSPSHWRDAWLEASIAKILASKKRSSRKRNTADQTIKKYVPRKPMFAKRVDHQALRQKYRRDVACPQNVTLVNIKTMNATAMITLDTQNVPETEVARRTQKAIHDFAAVIHKELANGGMCVDGDGIIMATPTCSAMPGLVLVGVKGHSTPADPEI